MYCYKCGRELPPDASFCPGCGKKCVAIEDVSDSEARVVQLKCKNCGGVMNVDEDAHVVFCPFCDSKELIIDSDAVAVEKIKSETYKEIEYAKMEKEQLKEEQQEENALQYKYRKGILSKITVLLVFVCAFLTFTLSAMGNLLAGAIGLVQVVAFAVSWLIGMRVIKTKRRSLSTALVLLGLLLVIPFVIAGGRETYKKLVWPKTGLATMVPDPMAEYGQVWTNNDDRLGADIDKYSEDQYLEFLAKCIDSGYTVDPEHDTTSYSACNEEGYFLELYYYSSSKSMDISLESPFKSAALVWPNTAIAQLVPVPKSNVGKIDWASDSGFMIYVAETSLEDFNEYADKVHEMGFTLDYYRGNDYYNAENADGYRVGLQYKKNHVMMVNLSEPY